MFKVVAHLIYATLLLLRFLLALVQLLRLFLISRIKPYIPELISVDPAGREILAAPRGSLALI
jgi:hypothetical protein